MTVQTTEDELQTLDTENDEVDDDLGAGAIAGIAIGGLAVLAGLGIGIGVAYSQSRYSATSAGTSARPAAVRKDTFEGSDDVEAQDDDESEDDDDDSSEEDSDSEDSDSEYDSDEFEDER